LSEEVNRSLARPAVRERLAERGATLVGTTPAAAAAFHRGEVEKFRRVAERAGISN